MAFQYKCNTRPKFKRSLRPRKPFATRRDPVIPAVMVADLPTPIKDELWEVLGCDHLNCEWPVLGVAKHVDRIVLECIREDSLVSEGSDRQESVRFRLERAKALAARLSEWMAQRIGAFV